MNLQLFEKIAKSVTGDRFRTDEILTKYYQLEGANLMQASLSAERGKPVFIRWANDLINAASRDNCCPLFRQFNSNVIEFNRDYFEVLTILAQLRAMTWQTFEDFCGALLRRVFSAVQVQVTQRGSDGGVDFHGKLPFKPGWSDVAYTFVEVHGQAKHYAGNVQRPDVDKFVGYATGQKQEYRYPAQIFLLCTTSDFASSAAEKLADCRFIGLNGQQLANMVFREYCSAGRQGCQPLEWFMS